MRDYRIDTVFDIDANVGQYAKLVRKYGFTGRILSFEPLSEAHENLQKTAERIMNGLWRLVWPLVVKMGQAG